MRATPLLLLCVLCAPGIAQAMDCSATPAAQPLRPTVIAPVANELAVVGNMLGAPEGVLADVDPSESVEQVLLRIRIEACSNIATLTPAPGTVSPDDPAAYKPRTEFDNTPWRFNMSQNGKKMTADEFSAWMKARGVRVARGAGAPAVPPQDPSAPVPAPDVTPAPPPPANPPTP
ncbi:MAG: hypothetical protein ACJ8GK_09655 [Luteimonas sp.]